MNQTGDSDKPEKTRPPTSLVYGYVSAIYLNFYYVVAIAVLLKRDTAETGYLLIGCCSCFMYLGLFVGTIAFLRAIAVAPDSVPQCTGGLIAIWWAPVLALTYSTLFR